MSLARLTQDALRADIREAAQLDKLNETANAVSALQLGVFEDIEGAVVAPVGALQTVPNPGDTPLTSDMLRDDIVATVLPAIRNNLTRLADKVDEIITVLTARGFIA